MHIYIYYESDTLCTAIHCYTLTLCIDIHSKLAYTHEYGIHYVLVYTTYLLVPSYDDHTI